MLLHIVNNIYVARFIHDSFHYDRMSIDALNGLKNFIVSNFNKNNLADFRISKIIWQMVGIDTFIRPMTTKIEKVYLEKLTHLRLIQQLLVMSSFQGQVTFKKRYNSL